VAGRGLPLAAKLRKANTLSRLSVARRCDAVVTACHHNARRERHFLDNPQPAEPRALQQRKNRVDSTQFEGVQCVPPIWLGNVALRLHEPKRSGGRGRARAEPDEDLVGAGVDVSHLVDLEAFLDLVMLVDADGVDPDGGTCVATKQRVEEVGEGLAEWKGDTPGFGFDVAARELDFHLLICCRGASRSCVAPGVRDGGIDGNLLAEAKDLEVASETVLSWRAARGCSHRENSNFAFGNRAFLIECFHGVLLRANHDVHQILRRSSNS